MQSPCLTLDVLAILRAHRKSQAEARLACDPAWQGEWRIFPNATGSVLSEGGVLSEWMIRSDWTRSQKRWRLIYMKFHGLRHLHATYLLVAGVHPKVVADRLGHSSTSVTLEIYPHITPGLQEGAAEAFAAMLAVIKGQATPPTGATNEHH